MADVQKNHPEDLLNLLSRVFPYLRSTRWDTRIATARAIGGIVKNAAKWDPNEEDEDVDMADIKSENENESENGNQDEQLEFDNFDIKSVITYGSKLLGSAGTEYDDPWANLDSVEKLRRQKLSLKKKMGLGGEFMDDDVLEAGDVKQQTPPPSVKPKIEEIKEEPKDEIIKQEIKEEELKEAKEELKENAPIQNARMRAMAKRRAKAGAKAASSKVRVVDLSSSSASRRMDQETPANSTTIKREKNSEYDITEQGHNDKVVIENKAPSVPQLVAMSASAEKLWPFEGFCELLMLDMLDTCWETRHGAVLGLREVLNVHGAGAGRASGKSKAENDKLNKKWLEDLACRLCCVFALDRFGDFVSDQVVAPVRESAAQTLGALLKHAAQDLVIKTFKELKKLALQNNLDLGFPLWEACHGGMLGILYLVTVRSDVVMKDQECFDGLIECILHGLKESDDDVQAVSAACLGPVAEQFITQRSEAIGTLLEVIWDCLRDLKDDLSASIGNVMDLLAKLCTFPKVLQVMRNSALEDSSKSFVELVPLLYPFLRHSITNVRKSVLRALLTFLDMEGEAARDWINGRILRLMFQNLLVEQNQQVLDLSLEVWNKLLDELVQTNTFSSLFSEHITPLITLIMTPIGSTRQFYKMDSCLFIRPSGNPYQSMENGENKKRKRKSGGGGGAEPAIPVDNSMHVNIDNPMFLGDVMLVGYAVFLRTKIAGCKALGRALSLCEDSQMIALKQPLCEYLDSSFSTQRLCASLILEEYGQIIDSSKKGEFLNDYSTKLMEILTAENDPMYRDLTPYLKAVRAQCEALFTVFTESGRLSRSKLPPMAVVVQGEADAGPDAFSLEHGEKIANETFDKLKKSLSTSNRVSASQGLADAHRNLYQAIEEAKDAKNARTVSIMSSAAAAYVNIADLPKKLNPIIRSLMDSVKCEENIELQSRTANSVASLVVKFLDANKKGPADKIVKNLCAFLCVDTSEVPEFHLNEGFEDTILSLRKEDTKVDAGLTRQREVKAAKIKRQGADLALQRLSKLFGAELFNKIPKLKDCLFGALEYIDKIDNGDEYDLKDAESTVGQEIIDTLSTIRALLPHLDNKLHAEFTPHFCKIQTTLKNKYAVLRYAAAKCFATICSVIPVDGFTSLVDNVLPTISNALELNTRQGAIECIYHLTTSMGVDILPYVVFLVVPVLGRMSDADHNIRLIATTTFASIIKLVPLESGIPDPPGMSQKLLEGREREREFIQQMLDVSKIQKFDLPVAIKADLRKYQQDGVNWLAFLNKYHLHGILCDDMGLGKTLQTICIVASDHHLRAEEHAKTGSSESRRLPSLVICPPTLTGHWQHEIQTYAPFMSVMLYVGNPTTRAQVSNNFMNYDVVVTSYDIARNDAQIVSVQNWNYCVLDEGHIIKNASSKLTKSIKTFVANHRLVLSGTPIQNNVLELWSIFDFLMPGFLGTEKVFNERFAKPIAASRNAKSSDKDQEAGALALEALHKQVLPFLLRRLKEDVLSDLPPKIIQDYYCELSDLQKRLYENFTKKQKTTITSEVVEESTQKESKQHVFQALQYMRKLCNHPALVMNPKHPQYESVTKDLGIKNQSLRDINHAPKLQALQALLRDCGIGQSSGSAVPDVTSQHRALIFCQLKDMLDMVENDLLKQCMPSVSYMRLDGSTEAKDRHGIVQQFNGDPSIDVLLLTTHVGGLGLNLTGADTVIFVEHDWNPMNDLQAMDRAHRIGQKKTVNVYRLITRNTLEEKIMGLQRFKLNIASTVINQQNSGLASMDTDQILDLFDVPDPESLGQTAGNANANGSNNNKDDDDMLDETGNVKTNNNKNNPIAELGELWDEKEYEEEYNLDNFIASLKE